MSQTSNNKQASLRKPQRRNAKAEQVSLPRRESQAIDIRGVEGQKTAKMFWMWMTTCLFAKLSLAPHLIPCSGNMQNCQLSRLNIDNSAFFPFFPCYILRLSFTCTFVVFTRSIGTTWTSCSSCRCKLIAYLASALCLNNSIIRSNPPQLLCQSSFRSCQVSGFKSVLRSPAL